MLPPSRCNSVMVGVFRVPCGRIGATNRRSVRPVGTTGNTDEFRDQPCRDPHEVHGGDQKQKCPVVREESDYPADREREGDEDDPSAHVGLDQILGFDRIVGFTRFIDVLG